MADENSNGHEDFDLGLSILDEAVSNKFEGAHLELDAIMAEDGRLAQAARQVGKNQGVINHVIAPASDEEYRDILLRIGNNARVQMFIEALAECREYKLTDQITYIVDRMHAEASNNMGSLLMNALRALTHTTITANTNTTGQRVKKWWDRNSGNSSRSGINEIG